MDKVTRELRVDLTPEEVAARRQSLAENGLQLVAWEANRKAVLAPIDAEGKHLKETRKDLAEAIETRKELRSVECAWFEEGTQRYLRRLDNGETIDQEPLSPEEVRKARQTSLPLDQEATPEAPSSPVLALPEHAGSTDGEAQPHEGGVIAPEAPYAAPALPAARHQDAVDGEIVVEAEPSEANVQRAVVRVLSGEGIPAKLSPGDWLGDLALIDFVTSAFPAECRPRAETIRQCLQSLKRAGRVELMDGVDGERDDEWRLLPEAPKAASKGKGKKGKGKASKEPPQVSPADRLAPPAPPASGHPQRVLRSWIWARVGQTVSITEEALAAEAKGFHREYVSGTVALLLACDCLMEWSTGVASVELPGEKTLDETVLDAMAHILLDAPLTAAKIAEAMETPFSVVWDVLEELRDQGRVAKRGESWALVGGKAAE